MKILLTTIYKGKYEAKYEELGIASIAAYIRDKGYKTQLKGEIFDDIDYNTIFNYLPDVVGLPLYASTKELAYKFIRRIKEKLPNVIIVLGGYLASIYDELILNENADIDFIVRGEGEVPFYNLLNCIKENNNDYLESITYRKNGLICRTKDTSKQADINSFPIPSRDYLIEKKYNVATCFFSRGCTARCNFCSTPDYWKKWRGRDTPIILEEIKYLHKLGVCYLLIQDCSFENPGSNYARVLEISKAIETLKLNIKFFIAIRAEFSRKMDKELIDSLKKSGLFLVNIGIEAGNPQDLSIYGKPANIEDNQRILDLLRENDIGAKIEFMNFNPYSTFESLQQNIDFLYKNNQAWKIWLLQNKYLAYSGTKLYERIKHDQLLVDSQVDNFNYYFQDSRIASVYDFVTKHIKRVIDVDTINDMLRFYDLFNAVFYEFYSQFPDEKYVVKEYENKYSQVLSELGYVNMVWYKSILEHYKNSEDHNIAIKLVRNFIENSRIAGLLQEVAKIKYELMSEFSNNEKYTKWYNANFYNFTVMS